MLEQYESLNRSVELEDDKDFHCSCLNTLTVFLVFPWHNVVNLKSVLVNEIGFLARISVRKEYQGPEAYQVEPIESIKIAWVFFAPMLMYVESVLVI